MSKTPQEEKRNFISYFLNNYQLATRESIWILNTIKKSNNLLDKISFVDSCKESKIGVIMKTVNEPGFDISYHAEGRFISKDAASIYRFFDSLSNKENLAVLDVPEIHIQLQFPKKLTDEFYQNIKLDSDSPPSTNTTIFNIVSEKEIDSFLEKIQRDFLVSFFTNEIDNALDKKDKNLFLKTISKMNEFGFPLNDIFDIR